MKSLSPLRYPGGKASLVSVLADLVWENELSNGIYVEPFAGGAGAALGLLQEGRVSRILINDADRKIYCFWHSVKNNPNQMVDRILSVPLTIDEWQRQRDIYRNPGRRSFFSIGFAAFYLNRCNRSGIMVNGGPIGGHHQEGKWKIDARFNREALASRVEEIASYGDRIIVSNLDAIELLKDLKDYCHGQPGLLYADPPYYEKGSQLYWRYYTDKDHKALAEALKYQKCLPWILTYDDAPEIRSIYCDLRRIPFCLNYSASKRKKGQELLILGDGVRASCLDSWGNRCDLVDSQKTVVGWE